MKITVEKEMTPGALLRELVEKHTPRHDAFDRPIGTGTTLTDRAYEDIASEFISAVRASILREGNQR
jgi:hypothetical protein